MVHLPVMIEFDPFRLDPVNQCLWRREASGCETRIEMRPKPYAILAYLAERAGRLVTQQELIEALWPQNYVQPEVLKSHVLSIRTTLGDSHKSPKFVETLLRRGYRFIAPIGRADGGTESIAQRQRRLVGRDVPLQLLQTRLRSAVDGVGQVVLVTGEAGIGKSALVEEFRQRALNDWSGLRVAGGQCLEGYGGKEAYYPVLEALGGLCRQPGGRRVIEILADKAPTWLIQLPAVLKAEHRARLTREILGATQERMLRELVEALLDITAEAPLLMIFSDLHWVDAATVDLIAAIARRSLPARLMVVCTYRPTDPALDDHPWRAMKQELMAHDLCSEIPLQRLRLDDVFKFMHTAAYDSEERLCLPRLLHRQSDGNPLFMLALLNHMISRGLVKREGDNFLLQVSLSEFEIDVPEGIRELIEIRIEKLSDEDQRTLEAASVLGTAFEAAAGAAAAALTIDAFEDVCERLARKQDVLRASADGSTDGAYQYRFTHDLYREVFYKRQPPSRRARIHARCGDWLESHGGSSESDVAPMLAHHFEMAASWDRAVKYLRMSANIAISRFANRDAVSILQHALELLKGLPSPQSRMLEIGLLESLCAILDASMDGSAIEAYETLVAKSAEYGFAEAHVRALNGSVPLVAQVDGQRSIQMLDRAIEIGLQIEDPALRTLALANSHINRIVLRASFKDSEAECRGWIDKIRALGNAAELAPPLLRLSWVQVHLSRHREALASAEEALASYELRSCGQRISLGHFARLYAYMLLGEWGSALKGAREMAALWSKNGFPVRVASIMQILPRICLHAGDHAGIQAFLDSNLSFVLGTNLIPLIRNGLTLSAHAKIGSGDLDQAHKLLEKIDQEMSSHPIPADLVLRPIVEWGLVEAWLATGELTKADLHQQRFANSAAQIGEITLQGLAHEAGVRIALQRADVSDARRRVSAALDVIAGFEVPLASWKIHASAAEVEELFGNPVAAKNHRSVSATIVRAIADSLPDGESVRQGFLASSRVRRVLETP